jgi:polyisoprenoid-binding protein YceI
MTINHEGHENTKVTRNIIFASCSSLLRGLFILIVVAGVSVVAGGTTWRATQGDVRITCPLTIGGSFQAKTAALSGLLTPGASHPPSDDGSFVVDLRTLDTGINLRNEHLREKYLEVDKAPGYDKATLSEIELKGMNPDSPEGKGSFTGSLMLHGTKKTVSGPAEIRKAGSGLRVKASFPVNLSDFAIPEPRYLGVGVKNTVQVEVTFTASPGAATATR